MGNVELVPLDNLFGSIVMLLDAVAPFCDASVSYGDVLVEVVVLLVLEDMARVDPCGEGGDEASTSVDDVEKGAGFFNSVPPSNGDLWALLRLLLLCGRLVSIPSDLEKACARVPVVALDSLLFDFLPRPRPMLLPGLLPEALFSRPLPVVLYVLGMLMLE